MQTEYNRQSSTDSDVRSNGLRRAVHGLLGFVVSRAELLRRSAQSRLRPSRQVACEFKAERLAQILEATELGIWEWSVQTGALEFDARCARLLGHAPGEIAPRIESWESRIHPEDWPRAKTEVDRHLAGETEYCAHEYRMRHKSGHWMWVLHKGKVTVRSAEGVPQRACGTLLDISERKQMEEALEHSEQRFSMIFGNLRSGVALYQAVEDGADFEIVDMNAAGLALCCLERPSVLGRRVTEVFPGVEESGLLAALRRVWRTGAHESLSLARHRDARIEQWLENCVFRLPTGIVVALYEDVSAERQAQQALREREAHYRHLIEAMPDILYRYSPARGIVYASPQIRRVLGFDPMETRHAGRWHDSIHPEDKPILEGALSALPQGLRYDVEYRVQDAEGTWHWFRDRAITCQFGTDEFIVEGIATDITDHKLADAERERLARAIEHADEAVIITDQDGTIQYVNPAFERVTGYTREEIIGNNPRILKSDLHDERFYRELWDTLGHGRTWQGRVVNKKKDGTLFTEDVTISPVHAANGKVTNFVSVKRDVTAHLKLSEEKQQIEAQFLQAQKMEAIGQLAGGVAHDFNNLLQVITGYADLAIGQIGPEHRAADSLREVMKAGERAATLISQLLAFSRRQVMRPEDLDLNELVLNLMKMLGRLIGEHVQFEFVPGQNLGGVHADRGMLEQILVNLCVNARDAMPGGGALRIGTDNAVIDMAFRAVNPWARPGDYVRLRVTDTGCGMSAETQERLFEPFFTTKEVGKGTGLGLAMVYGIVKQHGGAIICDSEEGVGTTFSIYLPLTQPKSPESVPEESQEAPGGTETILVVEDDRTVRELSDSILTRAGYTVLTAEDGAAAVRIFEENADAVDLVLLDVVMPVMGGKEAYDLIQAIRPGTPAIFASGYSESILHSDFVLDRGLILLQKPYRRRNLLCTLRRVLDKAQPVSPKREKA